MVRKAKKGMSRAERKTKATVRKVAKKKAARKPAAKKRVSAIKALENAIEVGIADLDDVAVSMGLLGAVEPTRKRVKKRT